jgi:hypothetical protein
MITDCYDNSKNYDSLGRNQANLKVNEKLLSSRVSIKPFRAIIPSRRHSDPLVIQGLFIGLNTPAIREHSDSHYNHSATAVKLPHFSALSRHT